MRYCPLYLVVLATGYVFFTLFQSGRHVLTFSLGRSLRNLPQQIAYPGGTKGCDFSKRFLSMAARPPVDAGLLLKAFDLKGGVSPATRKSFFTDFTSTLRTHGVRHWMEGGTLVQAMRNILRIPGEPPLGSHDDIDIGIRDVDLIDGGALSLAMADLEKLRFRIIRCGPQLISLERDGDYVDLMIFSSTPRCPVREPNAHPLVCSDGIRPYVLQTHSEMLLGVPAELPGHNINATIEYLRGMFGSNWRHHDKPVFGVNTVGNKTRGKSTEWSETDSRLQEIARLRDELPRTTHFELDPQGMPAPNELCPRSCPYTYQSVLANGRPMVRLDDYPYPSAMPLQKQQVRLRGALGILEKRGVPYVLGVSPLLMIAKGDLEQQINFLNDIVQVGYVCMHGFDHRTTVGTDVANTSVWNAGGEFAKYNRSELELGWQNADRILQRIHRYTREHFIPPFNAINQDMVNVLSEHECRFIHTFDIPIRNHLPGFDNSPTPGGTFGGILDDMRVTKSLRFIVSSWHGRPKTYAHAGNVNIVPHGSQVALHWYYDTLKPAKYWESHYARIAEALRKTL